MDEELSSDLAFSPRPWGCFWNGLTAEEINSSFPHARGGVSDINPVDALILAFSPRPWGCFLNQVLSGRTYLVFPTPVGVFLVQLNLKCIIKCFPHARGGVSVMLSVDGVKCAFSPRPWGCFHNWIIPFFVLAVFPTPVGVFPTIST